MAQSFTEQMMNSPTIDSMIKHQSPELMPADLLGTIAARCDYYATDPHSPFTERRELLDRAQAYRFEQMKIMQREQQQN